MAFFTYSQNNSGGYFHEPAKYVIVEADSPDHADEIAESHCDIYFHGCMIGSDCSCCGDRWSQRWEDGTEKPEVYGQDALNYVPDFPMDRGIPEVMIRYANGLVWIDGKLQ